MRTAVVLLFFLQLVSSQEFLWDQSANPTQDGYYSSIFTNDTSTTNQLGCRVLAVDDFIIPRGEIWNIDQILIMGGLTNGSFTPAYYFLNVFNTTMGVKQDPAFQLLNRNVTAPPVPRDPTFFLTPSLVLREGRYWLGATAIMTNLRTSGWLSRISTLPPDGSSLGLFRISNCSGTNIIDWTPVDRQLLFRIYGSRKNATLPVTTAQPPVPEQQSSSGGGSNGGAIAGAIFGVLGGILGVVGIVLIVFYIRKRSKSEPVIMNMANSTGYVAAPIMTPVRRDTETHSRTSSQSSAKNTEIDYTELEFGEEIGRGAYGVVFKGRWRGGDVAIKQLLLKGKLNDKELAAFRSEASLMKVLRPHVNVVQFLGITSNPYICIVTEFMTEGSLYSFVFGTARIDSDRLKGILTGIAAGMSHLHAEGIVHRDLACRNVLLGANFHPKITDFGLSRVAENDNSSGFTGSNVGPLKWMAPEAIKNKEYSRASDSWSFGVTLYEIVARAEPYGGLDPVQTALEVTHNGLKLVPPSYTPLVVRDIMISCFEEDPRNRPDFKYISKTFQSASPHEWSIR